MDIYRENILDHYKNPRNSGTMDDADVSHREYNASCGDDLTIFMKFDGKGNLNDVKFSGKGCAISQASMSMLTEFVKGFTIQKIREVTKDDIFEMLGTEIGPGRIKCALLPLKAINIGLEKWELKRGGKNE